MAPSLSTALSVGAVLTAVTSAALYGLLYSSRLQGLFLYLPIPFFWIDFSAPTRAQFLFPGIPRTTNKYVYVRPSKEISATDAVVRLGVWHTVPESDLEQFQRASSSHTNAESGRSKRGVVEASVSSTSHMDEEDSFETAEEGNTFDLNSSERKQKKVVLYFHGNGESRAYWRLVPKYKTFSSPLFDGHFVAFDYRGYSDSTGWPETEDAVAMDARAMWQWVTTAENGGLNASHKHIMLHAHSLGSAFATRLAMELSQQGTPPAALVLEAPFTRPRDVVADVVGETIAKAMIEELSNIDRIGSVDCPVLILHGKRDKIISYRHSEALHQRRVAERAQRRKLESKTAGKAAFVVSKDWTELLLLETADHESIFEHEEVIGAISGLWNATVALPIEES